MANPWFRFKQFIIQQDRSAFKVGTDGVLLGAWVDTEGLSSVLDVGTGTGLLALMLAQRSDANITAIEIDRNSFEEAEQNVNESRWFNRIEVVHCSLEDFTPGMKYDLVISNPPFFQDSLRPDDQGRSLSRHDTRLSLKDLAHTVPQLMNDKGRFCLILPVEESKIMERYCFEAGLSLHRLLEIRPKRGHPVKRHLLEFRFNQLEELLREELIVEYASRHDYTKEYRELTREFYLNF